MLCLTKLLHNNAINADSQKRRSFVASLFASGYGKRSKTKPGHTAPVFISAQKHKAPTKAA
jgi:hypothetical protein